MFYLVVGRACIFYPVELCVNKNEKNVFLSTKISTLGSASLDFVTGFEEYAHAHLTFQSAFRARVNKKIKC